MDISVDAKDMELIIRYIYKANKDGNEISQELEKIVSDISGKVALYKALFDE